MEEHGTLAHLATRVVEAAGHLAAAHVSASAQLASTVPTPHVVIPAQAQAAASANDDSVALADQLQWSSVKSIRTSVITLASFNVVAAAITIICVLRDARALDERNTRFQLR